MGELRVNAGELTNGGNGLLEGAQAIPDPLDPLILEGTDALSQAIARRTQEIEQPLIDGLPRTKEEAIATAQKILKAAGMYEQTDQQVADQVNRALEAQRAGGGAEAGGAGAGAAGSGQMMGMPMQMAQQAAQIPMQLASMAAQIPQGIMQGLQTGMQQMSQMAGQIGQIGGSDAKDGESVPGEDKDEKRDEEARERAEREKAQQEEKVEAGPAQGSGERAPDVGPRQAAPSPAAPEAVPAAPPAPKPAPTRPADSDAGVVL